MKIDIEFEYLVEFVPFRHRIPQHEASLATVTVDIAEPASVREVHRVSSDVRHDGKFGPFGRQPGRYDRGCRIVEHEGRLYREHCAADRLRDLVADRSRDAYQSPFHVNRRPSFKHLLTVDLHRPVDRVLDADALARKHGGFKVNTYRDDRGAKVAAALEERAAELIIHDGFVFVPTSEPVIAVVEDRDGDDNKKIALAILESRPAGWSAFEPHRSFQFDITRQNVFALSDHAGALAFAEAAAEASGCRFEDGAVVEKVSGDDLTFGGAWPVFRAANTLASWMGAKSMRMHPAVADAWADLRDSCAEFGGGCSVRVVKALDGFLDQVTSHGLPGIPEARAIAATALAGRRDLALETSTRHGREWSDIIQAYAALADSERAGLSWVRSASWRGEPAESAGLEASEILSSNDLARTAEHLNCTAPALLPPPGGRVIAVSEPTPYKRSVIGIVALDSRGLPEWSVGKSGRPVAPHVAMLAREYGMGLEAPEPEFDERDIAAFAL